MRIFYSISLLFSVLLLFSTPRAVACGYDWVGDCSSAVHLRINGTLDSFDIADCPSGIRFNSLYLGTLQSLSLANARAITWESCINNVTAVGLKYRLYEQGGAGGAYQTLNLDQDYFTVLGPYTTRYRSKSTNIDLATGLMVGETYILEVYLVAEVDTIGDDFIPETTFLKNNGGQNYRLSFTYGGPTAPPFVVIPTAVKGPNCHGESNGVAGVSVWGDHTGLFYNWSNINLNFFQQNSLPAGTYTVTVTGANYTESSTILLTQPDALTLQAGNIQPVTCGGGIGSITALPGGGTPPYQFLWTNGQTTATATFPNSGSYSLTLTDSHNCILVKSFTLPGGGTVQENTTGKICPGEEFISHGQAFDVPGVYSFIVSGNGGCDTLVQLTITEIDPSALLSNMPSSILLTCNAPSINLCAEISPDAVYQWWKDGIPATPTPCLLATAGGVYRIMVILDGCVVSKYIDSEAHLVEQPAQFVGTDTLYCTGFGTTPTLFHAITNAEQPSFLWTSNGQFLSSSDSCWFVISSGGFDYKLPELLVTDIYGCATTAAGMLSIVSDINVPAIFITTTDASGPNTPNGSAEADVSGEGPFDIAWSNGATGPVIQNLLPGIYCATVTAGNGCMSQDCEQVGYTVGVEGKDVSQLRLFPNPATPGDWLEIQLPEKFEEAEMQIELTDGQGKTILAEKLENTANGIHFQVPKDLTPGFFYLRVVSDQGRATGKLFLKK